jgi:hypothetical protein
MPTIPAAIPSLQDHLAEPLRLGDPDVHGPLAVFPLFGPAPQLGYVSFAQGCAAGASVKELEGGASGSGGPVAGKSLASWARSASPAVVTG